MKGLKIEFIANVYLKTKQNKKPPSTEKGSFEPFPRTLPEFSCDFISAFNNKGHKTDET